MSNEVKVYGNQHGTYVRFSGRMAGIVAASAKADGVTPEEWVNRALRVYLKRHLV